MKKRVISFLMAALLLAAPAAGAATMEGTVILEGMAETVMLTLHESVLGYSLWVNMERFALSQTANTDFFSTAAPGVSLSVSLLSGVDSLKAAGRVAAAQLVENGYKTEKTDGSDLFPAYGTLGYYGKRGDMRQECYVLETGRGYFVILMQYPAEAAEGFGARMRAIAATFQALP